MDNEDAETSQNFSQNSDICQQLLTRYSHSSAVQHHHLCATAAATRSIIQSSSLQLSPLSYFAATITSLSSSEALDSTALAALTSFLSIVLPLVRGGEIKPEKAEDAVRVLVGLVEESGVNLGTSSVRAVVKCLGVLVAEFCDLNNWESVAVGFERLLRFSMDKRPKVRKCSQDCILTIFKSFESSAVSKKASKLILIFLKERMRLALKIITSDVVTGSTNAMSNPELVDVIHLLNVIKNVVPYIYVKTRARAMSQLLKILRSHFSEVTMHIFNVISAIFESSGTEVIVPNAKNIFDTLVPYISLEVKNTVETAFFAATLAKTSLTKLHDGDVNISTIYLPLVAESLTGLLSSEANVSLQASSVFRELIEYHLDKKIIMSIKNQETEDESIHNVEFKAAKSICMAFYNALNTTHHVPDKHLLSAIALLFLKLDEVSYMLMDGVLLKLADLMNATSASVSEIKHLQDCIGSAVIAMGPDKVLSLIPISLNTNDFSCSNSWLIPVLKKNIFGSSLQYFMEHIVPLANSFEYASHKVIKSVIGQDLQAYAHDCWRLLTAFCRQPSDTYQSFGTLSKLLVPLMTKDSVMLESIAICLKELVNQNQLALTPDQESADLTQIQSPGIINEFVIDLKTKSSYSIKIASKNVKALAACSKELLQALINILFETPPDTRKHLKGAIRSLVSISDLSVTKQIFFASLKKFQILDNICDNGKVEHNTNCSADEDEVGAISVGTDAERFLILDLVSCFVDVSDKDLVYLIFYVIKPSFQATDSGQIKAYQILSQILEKHSWFCSSQFAVVMDLLSRVKSSANIVLLQNYFACLQTLLVHIIVRNLDEENTKTFLILNEIILSLKESNEEGRKAAYDAINGISSKLQKSSDSTCDGPYHKLITMIVGYLSGSSPHIKTGVVSTLSVLTYNDPDICLKIPSMFPSVLELLHSKAIEVIKAVLGFVKVFVSCLKPNDLQKFLPDLVDGILRWSSVSRHHFKTKITVILEIMIRKCGIAKVEVLVPAKYKDFVQEVVVNRRGKASSKETKSGETKSDLVDMDMSSTGNQKRKREQSMISSEEGSTRPWKRKGHKLQNSVKSIESSGQSGLSKGKPNRRLGGHSRSNIKRDTSVGSRSWPVGKKTRKKKEHLESNAKS